MGEVGDLRQQIIPLCIAPETDRVVDWAARKFIGTAFFVTKKGSALTAAHVVPTPEHLPPGWKLYAPVQRQDGTQIFGVPMMVRFDDVDVALLRVAVPGNKYFEVANDPLIMGTDVVVLGVPEHDVVGGGKEMRLLKGHVSLSMKDSAQLNISLPSGMSGGPVFVGGQVAGVVNGDIASEATLEATEYVERIRNDREQITIAKTNRMHYYGSITPLSAFASRVRPILDNRSLFQLIDDENK